MEPNPSAKSSSKKYNVCTPRGASKAGARIAECGVRSLRRTPSQRWMKRGIGATPSVMQRGSAPAAGGAWGGGGTQKQRIDEANIDMMESQNDKHWEQLGEQVDLLKKVSAVVRGGFRCARARTNKYTRPCTPAEHRH